VFFQVVGARVVLNERVRSGVTITIPRARIPALADVSASQLDTVTVSRAGDALSWRSADVDIAVRGLIRALFLIP
jgi:hypothetical protein